MAGAFSLGRRASGGYHTDRTRNGHGATHEPSAGLGNPGGGSAARKIPAANTSIRDFVEQVARPARGTAMGNGQSVNSPIWFLQVFTEVLFPGLKKPLAA